MTTKVSHGSVATQLWCGEMFNNHMTATCPQSLPAKKFRKSLNTGEDMDNHKVGRFFETQCTYAVGHKKNVALYFCQYLR